MQYSNKAKINYIALLQSFLHALLFSIVFLKNVSVNVFFHIKHLWSPPPPSISLKSPSDPDFDELYKKDINFYKTTPNDDANANINITLYDYTLRKTLFAEENNPTEKQWKSRLLFETTYRGNIIMYYDAFRMSFAYYSDEQIVPYKALYYAALKYVVRYRCRNFFIDMDTFPENPMIEILKKEDESLRTKSQMNGEKIAKPKQQNNNPVFAKFKNYREDTIDKKSNKPKHPFSNKFVRIGKLCEFNILQKPPSKKIEAINSLLFSDKPITSVTDFFDDIDIDTMPTTPQENTSKGPKDPSLPEAASQPSLPEDASHPFSTNQPKMTSYQLFKMMRKKQEKDEAIIIDSSV